MIPDDLFGEDFFEEEFEDAHINKTQIEAKETPTQIETETETTLPTKHTPTLFALPPDDRPYFAVETPQGRFYLGEKAKLNDVNDRGARVVTTTGWQFEELERQALEVHRQKATEAAAGTLRPIAAASGLPWVEKYAPVRFVDLLTPAEANRQLMLWLKGWREKIAAQGRGERRKEEEEEDANDPDKPIHRPVLVLCGAPSSGKSVMVDICAKKSGFSVLDYAGGVDLVFSKEALDKTINSVCTNASVVDSGRPRLLLLEAEGEAEQIVLEAVVRAKERGLLRPVIVVLTAPEPDAMLWSRAVRPLHPFAQLLSLASPSVLKVQERVREVSKTEGVAIESLAVNKLVEICGNDIRTALNQLQALSSAKADSGAVSVSVADVVNVGASGAHGNRGGGVKDAERSEEELLTALFKSRKARVDEKRHRQLIIDEILPEIKAAGTSTNIAALLAHGLTAVPFTDPGLRTLRSATQALALGDRVGDLSLATLAISANCASVGHLRLEMPEYKKNAKLRYQIDQERKAVYASLCLSRTAKSRDTRLLLVPGLFLASRSPGHPNWVKDPKAKHAELERLVSVFHSYSLSLTAVVPDPKKPDEEEFHLSPSLDILAVKFPLWSGKDAFEKEFLTTPFWRANRGYVELFVKKLAAVNKQSTAQLVTKLKVAPPTQQTPGGRKRLSTPGAGGSAKKTKTTPSAVQAINMEEWCGASKKRLDFDDLENSALSDNKKKPLFEFHFQEGHTNAVKRPVSLKEFTRL